MSLLNSGFQYVQFGATSNKYEDAARYAQDALAGRTILRNMSSNKRFFYILYHSKQWNVLHMMMCVFYMFFSFYERPSSINGSNITVPLTPWIQCLIQGLILAFFWFDTYMDILCLTKPFLKAKWSVVIVVLLICMTANWVLLIFIPKIPQVFRIFRPFLLIKRKRNIRRIFSGILTVIPEIVNILLLIFVTLLVFSIFGFVFFSGMDNNHCDRDPTRTAAYCSTYKPGDCTDYFNSLVNSMVQLYILLTTANYPDIMMPVYRCNRWFSLFFVVYQSIGMYCLFNLVLALIYSNYEARTKSKLLTHYGKLVDGLNMAFNSLKTQSARLKEYGIKGEDGKVVTRQDFIKFMICFQKNIPSEIVGLCFDTVDVHRYGEVNRNDFCKIIYTYTNLKAKKIKSNVSIFYGSSDGSTKFQKIQAHLENLFSHNKFVIYFFDLLVLANSIIIIIEMIQAETSTSGLSKFTYIQTIMVVLFSIELILKMIGFGLVTYFTMSIFNDIDFVAVVGSLFGTVLSYVGLNNSQEITQVLLILRMLRLLRLLRLVRRFDAMINSLKIIVPALGRYIVLLLCVYYSYSIIGMELFAGKLPRNNDKIANCSYGVLNYYHNNFDNLPNSMVTLWEQQIVNNWPIVMEGVVAGTNSYSRIYFIVWNLLSVYLVMNVVLAFLLESFSVMYEKQVMKKEESGGEEGWWIKIKETAKANSFNLKEWKISKVAKHNDVYEAIFSEAIHNQYKQLNFGWYSGNTTETELQEVYQPPSLG